MEKDTSICLACGRGRLQARKETEVVEQETPAGRVAITVRSLPREVCDHCGEVFFGPVAARKKNRAIARALGILSSGEIRKIRKSFASSRREFCQLTGLGEEIVLHWEEGKTIPSLAMDKYLRVLSRSPSDTKRFLGMLGGAEGKAKSSNGRTEVSAGAGLRRKVADNTAGKAKGARRQ